jgi:hypothetical protein
MERRAPASLQYRVASQELRPPDVCHRFHRAFVSLFFIVKAELILVKPRFMKHPIVYSLSIFYLALLASVKLSSARPIDFNEVSLFVRAHQSESSIKEEVSRRKLMHALTPQQESTLKSQGASDSLIQSLRNANLVASKEETAAIETRDRQAQPRETMPANASNQRVFVFNVAFGHAINLSQWGGLDYEIAFYSYRIAGEDYVEPALVDNVRTGTDVARNIPLISENEAFARDWFPTNEARNWRFTPYDARGDLKDTRVNFSDSVAISSHSFARPMRIDWDNPVFIDGQPYTFYPVYGAGGVSLYYISKASDRSATVAVVTHRL